jgi:ABC transport system ATP-binding/permease protein
MKESVLKSIMRLFAIVSQVHSINELGIARRVVEAYLKLFIRPDHVRQYLIMYDFYHNNMRERENKTGEKQISLFSVKAMIICEKANEFLTKKQKVFILTHILEIISATGYKENEDIDFIKTIARALKIEEQLFSDCLSFVFDNYSNIQHQNNILFVSNKPPNRKCRHVYKEFLKGQVVFLYVETINICLFKHVGKDDQLYFNDKNILLNETYTFEKGAVIKSPLLGIIYFKDIIKAFLHDDQMEQVIFAAKNASYNFPDGEVGIESFSLNEEAGQLIGIMGGSGVGKSTLINLLDGNITPTKGVVLLNGYDVHHEKEPLNGLIGYVPQDDLLIEELTVFQNLYFNARLCYKGYTRQKILLKVQKLLHSLDLSSIKHLKVGSAMNKYISGGQRKRLNIALELIREPYVLFVDEPTSGLSSNDSEKVIDLLKLQSLMGKLVIVNIHQPSSDIFKQLDKLIILDSGGRFVFHGNPQDALVYFKKYNQLLNAEEGECPTCGNLNPDQILLILESNKVNEFGDYVSERLVDAKEWYENYQLTHKQELNFSSELKMDLPKVNFQIPSKFEQFKIFNIRNILTKLSDKQYLLINILEAPILAFILAWFTKYKSGTPDDPLAYVFSGNINVPVYIFMGVVVAIFLGLMLSAEDIIRDRKILKREAFLNLSRFSYFNSKILFLAIVLAIQIFLFVFIGNSILNIKGMLFQYWLMFWMTSMVSGMLGLNVSATLKSVVAIYILIPILLIPQILLGGAMIRFDKLNQRLANTEYVPFVGDIIPSRWAYEAIMVHQFSNNKYQKLIFDYDRLVSQNSYNLNYYIPELLNIMSDMRRLVIDPTQRLVLSNKIEIINNEIINLKKLIPSCFDDIQEINSNQFNISVFSSLEQAIQCARKYYIRSLSEAIDSKDNRFYELDKLLGGRNKLLELRDNYYNETVADIVLNKDERQKLLVIENKIIRKIEPIFYYPDIPWGRAHFFAPSKRIGNFYIDTYWFNLIMLLIMTAFFYLTLVYRLFPKIYKRLNIRTISVYISRLRLRVVNILKPSLID